MRWSWRRQRQRTEPSQLNAVFYGRGNINVEPTDVSLGKNAAERRFSLLESQQLPNYTSNGRAHPRIAYGDDDSRWGQTPCRGCGAERGQFHRAGDCPYEQCPVCRASQLGTCPHQFVELDGDGADSPSSGPTKGDRVLTGILVGSIGLCLLATLLAVFRVL